MKISILLSISNDAPIPFLQILPSISHETTVSSFQLFCGVFQFKSCWILLYVRAVIFKENERGVAVYSISCVAKRILSEASHTVRKYGDAKSTGFVPYFKDNYYK